MKLLKFSGLLLLTTIFSSLAYSTYAKEPVITKTNTGFKFGSSQNINTATITDWNFKGECPGSEKQRKLTEVRFISESTLPASGLRVLVRNISKGFEGNPVPFSDREYNERGGSEALNLEFSTRHHRKYLALSLEGETLKKHPVSNTVDSPARPLELWAMSAVSGIRPRYQLISSSEISNSFEYEIRRGSEVIETGKFTVLFEKQLREANRSKIRVPERAPEYIDKPICIQPSIAKPGSCEKYSSSAGRTVKPGNIWGYKEQCPEQGFGDGSIKPILDLR